MLPSFSRLRLCNGADTGGFYNPTPDEVDDLNRRQEQDPVTLEDFVSVFRVTVLNANGTETHKHYNAQALWRSIQSTFAVNGRLEYPGLQTPVWREDWYALHSQYDPDGPVPPEVAQLSRLDSSTGDDTEGESSEGEPSEGEPEEDESEEEEHGPEGASEIMNELRQRHDAARDYPSRERWDEIGQTVNGIIERCSNEGGQDFQNAFQDLVANGDNETFFRNALARTSPNDTVVKGILIKLLSFLVLEEDEARDMVRRWNIRDDVRRYVVHNSGNLTHPDPPSGERRAYESAHQDNRASQAERLVHYLKWQEWIPDSLMASQSDHNSLRFPSRPLSQAQQAVVDELKTRLAALVAKLASLQVDAIPSAMRIEYDHCMKEIEELGERMLQTADYPLAAERRALAVDMWVAMNTTMDAKLLMDTTQLRSRRFQIVATELLRLVWLTVSVVHEDIAQPEELTVDLINDFFWRHVSKEYERPPNDEFSTERVEEILTKVSEFWAEELVGLPSPARQRQRVE